MDLWDYDAELPQPLAHPPANDPHELLYLERTSKDLEREPESRAEIEGSCPVCGDRVSGYHYGLLTCESCKGFFKRSVQNNKHYSCSERQRCPMNPSQRKRCPFCRFQKCLAVGMKREAVRADRMRGGRNKFGPFYRRDRQLKQQVYYQPSTAPYRVKAETTPTHQPTPQSDHLMINHPLVPFSSEPFYQPHVVYPSGLGLQSEAIMPQDCIRNTVTGLAALPFTGLYQPNMREFPQEKTEYPLSSSLTLVNSMSSSMAGDGFLPSSPAMSASNSTSSSTASTPVPFPYTSVEDPSEDFLAQLLNGEPEEGQLCAKVLASLQREQANRGKHDCLNTFSIMCKMADQTLFGLVEWARNCAFFKDLKVEDQMALLQSCWSELLVLDHLSRQVTYAKEGCIYLVTGQQIEVSTVQSQAGLTLSSLVSRTQDLVSKLKALHLDKEEFVCLKYLVLFNPDVKSIQSRRQVERTQEQVNRALMEHTQRSQSDKFGQLLLRLPEVRSISLQVEEYLYQRHLLGDLPCNSLLTEMLHTKHS
ncbi:nuclear receptor subfamily 5, group A, member 5 isoform X1 [Gadus morhua]|uniref:nuclear receptor subfamily 5, group A, member 5 isoform X1 n=2 Tax=Gadus morhua TaxID=8049 RepID=UPI0011B40E69|nr:nuclear receptor subfamily 5 group A member 2-like isoform X1 [Gadus morhua]